jgi:hypothetical protein
METVSSRVYLSDARTIVASKATSHPINRRRNVTQLLAVHFFRFRAQGCYGQHLLIFHNSLVQLFEQYPQTTSVLGRPKGIREPRHVEDGTP